MRGRVTLPDPSLPISLDPHTPTHLQLVRAATHPGAHPRSARGDRRPCRAPRREASVARPSHAPAAPATTSRRHSHAATPTTTSRATAAAHTTHRGSHHSPQSRARVRRRHRSRLRPRSVSRGAMQCGPSRVRATASAVGTLHLVDRAAALQGPRARHPVVRAGWWRRAPSRGRPCRRRQA